MPRGRPFVMNFLIVDSEAENSRNDEVLSFRVKKRQAE
jgi:hypothetical protein